jgi:hypothetical protein
VPRKSAKLKLVNTNKRNITSCSITVVVVEKHFGKRLKDLLGEFQPTRVSAIRNLAFTQLILRIVRLGSNGLYFNFCKYKSYYKNHLIKITGRNHQMCKYVNAWNMSYEQNN